MTDKIDNKTKKTSKVDEKKKVTKKLSKKQKIDALQKENLILKDKLARSFAEFENFRNRSNREKTSWIKYATQKIVIDICDVVDNFERALDFGSKEHEFKSFIKGTRQIFSQLKDILKKENVEKMDVVGKVFDPNEHEALSHLCVKDVEKDTVAFVIKNGYKKGDKILRPAQVAVSSGNPKEQKKQKENSQEIKKHDSQDIKKQDSKKANKGENEDLSN